jgi:hypothetical protein
MQIDMFENCHFIHIYIYIKQAIWFGAWIDMNWGHMNWGQILIVF